MGDITCWKHEEGEWLRTGIQRRFVSPHFCHLFVWFVESSAASVSQQENGAPRTGTSTYSTYCIGCKDRTVRTKLLEPNIQDRKVTFLNWRKVINSSIKQLRKDLYINWHLTENMTLTPVYSYMYNLYVDVYICVQVGVCRTICR